MLSASLWYTAWHWHERPNCLCFPLAKHPHIGAPPVSYPQYDDLAGFHAFPFYSWWIAAADGFLSLKIPVGRAWWIAPDCCGTYAPAYHPRHHCFIQNVDNMLLTHQIHLWSFSPAILPKSPETSAVTKSILSSCVNTNKVGATHQQLHTHGEKRRGLIWNSHYPSTMHSHDRPTRLISHSFRQQLKATLWGGRPVMVAESFNGSITVSSLCRTRPFVQYKSVSTWGRMPLMLTMDCSIQDYQKYTVSLQLENRNGENLHNTIKQKPKLFLFVSCKMHQ